MRSSMILISDTDNKNEIVGVLLESHCVSVLEALIEGKVDE